MSETAQAKFSCPSCGRQFTWKPELAGRSAKCKCGGTIKVPQQPQAAAAPTARAPAAAAPATDDGNPLDSYDFSAAEAPAPRKASRGGGAAAAPVADAGMRCPACGNGLQPGAVLCVHCGFNLKTGKRMSTILAADEPGLPVPAPAAPGIPGVPGYAGPPGLRPPRAEEKPGAGQIVKMVAIPVVLIGVVGGAVFGFKMLAGEKDTGPKLGHDPEVRAMIREDGATELKQWLKDAQHRMVLGMTREQADGMADRLYTLGAVKVMAFGGATTASLAVELPDASVPENKEKRKALFEWYTKRYEEHTPRAERTRDEGQQYLLLPMSL